MESLRDEETGPSPQHKGSSNYDDPSGKIWSVYATESEKHDRALAEGWKSDMDGMLIFAGLFSASVTAFIVESYQSLQPDPRDTTNALLTQILQQLGAASNGSTTNLITPSLSDTTFKPASSALRLNAYWFLSLAFSLSCAMSATLVQQWARHYVHAIERRPAPHKQARIRAYLFEGVTQFGMVTVVNFIPALLHISVFLFLVGLVEFLIPINRTIGWMMLGVAIVCISLYIAITFLPTMYRNCPYRTPFSGICWRFMQLSHLLGYYNNSWRKFILLEGDIAQGREYLAMEASPDRNKRDKQALRDTLEALKEHSELEPFVEGMPGFIRSNEVVDGRSMFQDLLLDRSIRLESRIARLLLTCQGPDSMLDRAMERRALACLNAIISLTKEPPSAPWMWVSCFGEHTTYVVHIFRSSKSSIIAYHACCTAALIVNKLHIDISKTLEMGEHVGKSASQSHHKGVPMNMQIMQDLDRGIYALQFLGAIHSLEAAVGLEVVDSKGNALRWTRLLEELRDRLLLGASHADELRRILNKARIYALVDFIRVLMTFPTLPDESEGSSLTRDTLRVITADLLARHADAAAEWHLVRLLARLVGAHETDEPRSELGLPPSLIDVFLRVFATLGDREARKEAGRLVKGYKAVEPGSDAAKRVLFSLNSTYDI